MARRRQIVLLLALIIVLPMGGLKVWGWIKGPPDDLGVKDGRLRPCPSSPNCVSSYAADKLHDMSPIAFTGAPAEALRRLKQVLDGMPRTKVIEQSDRYLRVEFRTAIMRFVDDGEFLLDVESKQIHFRSAARLGYSDLGKNRKRMTEVREAFESSAAAR